LFFSHFPTLLYNSTLLSLNLLVFNIAELKDVHEQFPPYEPFENDNIELPNIFAIEAQRDKNLFWVFQYECSFILYILYASHHIVKSKKSHNEAQVAEAARFCITTNKILAGNMHNAQF
jgi:hypothetical protein